MEMNTSLRLIMVDNQDMLSNVKWGKYIIGDLFEG